MAGKTAKIRGKRITAKQRVARVRNIAIARKSRRVKGKRLTRDPNSGFEKSVRRNMKTLFSGGSLSTGSGGRNRSVWEAFRRVKDTKNRVKKIKAGGYIKW